MSLSIAERQLVELRIRNDGPNIAVAYVLWAVLGLPVSAHRFYLGRPRSAIYQIISVFLLVGIFWWLLDAALISGIIRDQKETMRQALIREIEEGRGGDDAPPPRRFVADPEPVPARAPEPVAEPVRAAPLVEAPPPAPVPIPSPAPSLAPAPEPEMIVSRTKPQPFGLQSLGDEPVAPPPVAEPFMLRPAPAPEPIVAPESVAAPEPAAPAPFTESAEPPRFGHRTAPIEAVAPAEPSVEPEARPFGFRLSSPEPEPPVAEAVPPQAPTPAPLPTPGEPGSGRVQSDTVIRFPSES